MKCRKIIFVMLVSMFVITVTQNLGQAQQAGSFLDTSTLKINGGNWTFRTSPPPAGERTVLSSHPRLFLTLANLPGMKAKLADPVYASDIIALKKSADDGNGFANAFLYLIEGDVNRGTVAKNWLLAGIFSDVLSLETAAEWVVPVLVFDWVMPLLSNTEKTTAFNLVKSNFGYDHRTALNRDAVPWYWNDEWARHRELHYPILALAIAGDGIDNLWAQEVLDLAYNESTFAVGPYGSTHGSGFLDVLATLSLDDGGGAQAGSAGKLGTNYYGMFLHSFMPLGAWESATGQPMWARCNFFRKLPFYWVYDKKNPVDGAVGLMSLEFITGIYRDIDPDAAALARWMVNKWGRSKYTLVERLIFGDLRVLPKSPKDLNLPTAKYIRGADLFVSSRNWDENALTLTAYSRYLDTSRFEPGSGLFAIHRGGEPLAVASEPKKQRLSLGFYSGLWIYDSNDVLGTRYQKSTYESNNRAFDGYTPASDPLYFPKGPDRIEIKNTYRGISTNYTKLVAAPGVRTARQTIIHIMDTNRDFIVVYDYSDVPSTLKRAWSMRLATPPNIQQNKYSIPGMHTTIVGPVDHTITWVGGLNDEMKSPPPEKIWYGNNRDGNRAGYSSDSIKAKKLGIGNLYVQSQNTNDQLAFLVVNEVTDGVPVAVTRVSDQQVRFGGWDVTFGKDGSFTVNGNDGGDDDDNIPPVIPAGLRVK